ncbi:hypothetical protein EVAR_42650_1 [Eumeta japonica]|uniref:Uncharacterized protein n=1 Tax=Eumeta variegata TaxID=151549 RepID=A0A4C1WZG6_EUMVA|nr:hypothetical protein EVAR_42650_1 [Eumeta japonica]
MIQMSITRRAIERFLKPAVPGGSVNSGLPVRTPLTPSACPGPGPAPAFNPAAPAFSPAVTTTFLHQPPMQQPASPMDTSSKD